MRATVAKGCEIGPRLLLITNRRKSHIGFQITWQPLTLDDLDGHWQLVRSVILATTGFLLVYLSLVGLISWAYLDRVTAERRWWRERRADGTDTRPAQPRWRWPDWVWSELFDPVLNYHRRHWRSGYPAEHQRSTWTFSELSVPHTYTNNYTKQKNVVTCNQKWIQNGCLIGGLRQSNRNVAHHYRCIRIQQNNQSNVNSSFIFFRRANSDGNILESNCRGVRTTSRKVRDVCILLRANEF